MRRHGYEQEEAMKKRPRSCSWQIPELICAAGQVSFPVWDSPSILGDAALRPLLGFPVITLRSVSHDANTLASFSPLLYLSLPSFLVICIPFFFFFILPSLFPS